MCRFVNDQGYNPVQNTHFPIVSIAPFFYGLLSYTLEGTLLASRSCLLRLSEFPNCNKELAYYCEFSASRSDL